MLRLHLLQVLNLFFFLNCDQIGYPMNPFSGCAFVPPDRIFLRTLTSQRVPGLLQAVGARAAPAVTGEESKAWGSKRLSCPYTCLSCVSSSGGGGWRKRQEAGGRADGFMENLPVPSDSQMRFWLRKGLKHICYHMFLSPEINIILDSV